MFRESKNPPPILLICAGFFRDFPSEKRNGCPGEKEPVLLA
ncbi:hypothetical protein B4135_1486 [Caldibacillus debilis]|uniref:Uncharacterized protein n=1 Tax=Caldibacillus debilis TaxID=301148 RepID=A0A150MCI1_9BACI|nr:hypothetical protein B4135_1486 [Caldibacillus debilis]